MSTGRNPTRDLGQLWRSVVEAGGVRQFVDHQLRERGFLIERKPTDTMSQAELARYKKSLKEEAAERKRIQKEAWQAYRSKHIVHLGEGVFWNDAADLGRFDLDGAPERAAENELPALDKPEQLAEALGLTVPELRWLAYHRDVATRIHYRRFTIPKRDGTERPIWAPLPKLKQAQRWILSNIVERLPVHGAAHGFLVGRSTLSNAQAHAASKAILKVDLKDFFPTLTLPRVKGVFRKAGYREQISTLLALLCTEAPREIVELEGKKVFVALGDRCLPQGAPTSPALTNTVCLRLDRRLSGLAAKLGWRYTRYADDLTFSLPENHSGAPRLGLLLGSVGRIVASEGFRVHPKKTRVSRSGSRQRVTGLVVNGKETPRVPRELKRQLRAAIHNLGQGKPLRDGDSLAKLIGYAAYVYMAEPAAGKLLLQQLTALDQSPAP